MGRFDPEPRALSRSVVTKQNQVKPGAQTSETGSGPMLATGVSLGITGGCAVTRRVPSEARNSVCGRESGLMQPVGRIDGLMCLLLLLGRQNKFKLPATVVTSILIAAATSNVASILEHHHSLLSSCRFLVPWLPLKNCDNLLSSWAMTDPTPVHPCCVGQHQLFILPRILPSSSTCGLWRCFVRVAGAQGMGSSSAWVERGEARCDWGPDLSSICHFV